jgi:hypothetical protein
LIIRAPDAAGRPFQKRRPCQRALDISSCTGGGAPRWSIPINVGGDPKDALMNYAFLDGNGCINGGETPSGGAITVSTTLAQCSVNFQGLDYANWDAFAAAHPTYTIASALPFVVSDTHLNNAGGTIDDIVITNVNSTKS